MSDMPVAQKSGIDGKFTTAEFQDRMNSDAEFRNAYLKTKPGEWEKDHITDLPGAAPQEPTPPQGGGQKDQGAIVPQDDNEAPEMIDVAVNGQTVKISRDQLGTYLTNRNPADAIVEALKGNKEKDKTIDVLLQRDRENEQTTTSLRQRIKDAEAKRQQPPPQAAAPKATESAIVPEDGELEKEIDGLEKDFDYFDESHKGKLFSTLRKQAAEISRLKKLQDSSLKPVQELIEDQNRKAASAAIEEASQKAIVAEFNEIEELFGVAPDLRPTNGKTFQQIDLDVGTWLDKIERIAPRDHKGNAQALFHEQSPAGEAFRQQCSAANLNPPECYEQHIEVMALRNERLAERNRLRDSLEKTVGRKLADHELPAPVTYLDIYGRRKLTSGEHKKELLDAQIKGHKRVLDAADRSDRAREAPPERSVPPTPDWKSMGIDGMSKLLAKPTETYTDEEAAIVGSFYQEQHMPMPAGLKARLNGK